jgi:antitoxin CptB
VLYRASHRGTREMDFVLGRFVDAEIEALTERELDELEHLLDAPDPELFEWVAGRAETPPDYDTEIFRRIVAFHGMQRTK